MSKRKQIDVNALMKQLAERPERPIQSLCEDSAALEGIIDVLVLRHVISEDELTPYLHRYQSIMSGLVMLLIEKGIIEETDLDKAILSYHHVLRTVKPDLPASGVFALRREYLATLLD